MFSFEIFLSCLVALWFYSAVKSLGNFLAAYMDAKQGSFTYDPMIAVVTCVLGGPFLLGYLAHGGKLWVIR